MARIVKHLINTGIKHAKAREKPYKLSDGSELFLLVQPNGSKWWRFKYATDGKEKLPSMGIYDDATLQFARDRREEARKLLAAGVEPGVNRKAAKLARAEKNANTLEVIAREWIQKQPKVWTVKNKIKVNNWFEKDIFPWLGGTQSVKLAHLILNAPWIGLSNAEPRTLPTGF